MAGDTVLEDKLKLGGGGVADCDKDRGCVSVLSNKKFNKSETKIVSPSELPARRISICFLTGDSS